MQAPRMSRRRAGATRFASARWVTQSRHAATIDRPLRFRRNSRENVSVTPFPIWVIVSQQKAVGKRSNSAVREHDQASLGEASLGKASLGDASLGGRACGRFAYRLS